MSKIIYYIGAGASYGKRAEGKVITGGIEDEILYIPEGLPVVNEIPQNLLAFRKAMADAVINQEEYVFKNMYRTNRSIVETTRQNFLSDIDDLYVKIKEHATIDTYAKKLYLTRNKNGFQKLKEVLCTYFVWAQLNSKPDQRYDTFLANVLTMDLFLPKEISFISWNYDSQFELAYRSYSPNGDLQILEKNRVGNWPELKERGCIFKVNGSATFADFNAVTDIVRDNDLPKDIQLIMFYGNLYPDTTALGFNFQSHLSFAWEDSDHKDNMLASIHKTTEDTQSVVVIGYSFPYFNREMDREIFSHMPHLSTIYIQDIHPDAVEPSLKAALPEGSKVKIEYITNCSQFYLPREL